MWLRKHIWSLVVCVPVCLIVLSIGGWIFVFDMVCSRNLSKCKTRTEVRAVLHGFRERELGQHETPAWSYLHLNKLQFSPAPWNMVTCEYRYHGLWWRHAAVDVAYDKKGNVIGLYEYD
jgi:hypothetical protein